MKQVLRTILIFITFSTSYNLSGQVLGKFGSNQSTLDPNAVLEVESTSKGVLLPRLTTAQQNAMSAPTNGMLIYNTDSACFVLRRAGIWRSLCAANSGDAWSTLGNTGTNVNSQFLGTTDNQDLAFKTNNLERIRISASGNVGIGTTTPSVKMDVDGALALRPSSTSITADNQAVTVSNRSFLRLTSDGTPANRTITLSNGLQDGQQLVIRVIGAAGFGIELADSGNLNLSGLAQLDDGDTITLIWDGTIWYELYRSSN
jgi:hypothetical protein